MNNYKRIKLGVLGLVSAVLVHGSCTSSGGKKQNRFGNGKANEIHNVNGLYGGENSKKLEEKGNRQGGESVKKLKYKEFKEIAERAAYGAAAEREVFRNIIDKEPEKYTEYLVDMALEFKLDTLTEISRIKYIDSILAWLGYASTYSEEAMAFLVEHSMKGAWCNLKVSLGGSGGKENFIHEALSGHSLSAIGFSGDKSGTIEVLEMIQSNPALYNHGDYGGHLMAAWFNNYLVDIMGAGRLITEGIDRRHTREYSEMYKYWHENNRERVDRIYEVNK